MNKNFSHILNSLKAIKKWQRIALFLLLIFNLQSSIFNYVFAAFDDIAPGIRPASMGGAFTAISDDSNAIFYNPAGLYLIKNNEFSASFGRLYYGLTDNSNISDSVISYINPFGEYGTVGMGIRTISLSSLYSEKMILFSYGIRIKPKLGIGLTMKSLSHKFGADDYTENAISDDGTSLSGPDPVFSQGKSKSKLSADFGIFYRPASKYNLGLAIQNFNSPDIGLQESDKVEKTVRLGFAYIPKTASLSLEVLSKASDTDFIAGFEKYFSERLLALRGALTFGSRDLRRLSVGLGINQAKYKVDYAFIFPLVGINNTYGSHKISVSFMFGPLPNVKQLKPEFPGEVAEEENVEEELPKNIVTEENKRAAELMMKNVQEAYRKGLYSSADENITRVLELNPEHQGAKMIKKKIKSIASVLSEKTDMEKASRIIRKGITAYIENNPTLSFNAIKYATELLPDDLALQQLYDLISKEFPDVASKEESIPGLNLVGMKLQKALENIYEGKYVQAISECNTVLDLEEDNVLALMRLGSAYWAIGSVEKAKSVWKIGLKLEPNNKQISEFLAGEATVPKVEKLGEKPLIRKYVVLRGDSPQSLSVKFYGNKTSWGKIYEANKDKLPNRWSLVVGQELVIP
ncbi:MAG: LysM peptidoglycan-binding domain-containing protein [Elusimicrobia bacterium]|nr:LysM peptidoglycan-binding domain-containing protein [Elusimicrobiota bacterium]